MPVAGPSRAGDDRLAGLRAAFDAGGEMGARMAATDWSATPLGPIERWPQSLVSSVSIMIASRAQIAMFWGPEFVALYNDAYIPAIGANHPEAFGRPARVGWAHLWDVVEPLFTDVVRSGQAYVARDGLFPNRRKGFLEDAYFDVTYDPVRTEDGSVGGLFCIVAETTARVLNERRLTRLASLDAALAHVTDPAGVMKAFLDALDDAGPDLPFVRVRPGSGWPDPAALAGGVGEVPAGLDLRDDATDETRLLVAGEVRGLRVPLRSASGDLGSVVLGVNPRHDLDDAYERFLRFLAERLASALTTARAYEAEHRAAVTLQQAILPARLTRIGGVELDSVYLAATQGLEVGGDWFDALEVDGGQVALVIGDVAGKGVTAAALMAQMRNALRVYLLDGLGPAEALTRLNRLMIRLETAQFSTLLCALVDPATGTVRMANAGHLPTLRVRADGPPDYLMAKPGPPIGVTALAVYSEVVHRVGCGDVLALFTDGLVEERTEALDVGLERAARAAAGAGTASDVLARLRALRQVGDRQDDIAVVTARLP